MRHSFVKYARVMLVSDVIDNLEGVFISFGIYCEIADKKQIKTIFINIGLKNLNLEFPFTFRIYISVKTLQSIFKQFFYLKKHARNTIIF